MSLFTETVHQNTARFVVVFQFNSKGQEEFQWGILGDIPPLTLLGCIEKVQSKLIRNIFIPGTDAYKALVLAWDSKHMHYFCHQEIPVDALVGMLETIKSEFIKSRSGQHAAAQRIQLVGPDGQPVRKGVS